MYLEWKLENKDVRPLLLFFLELYATKFMKPIYFSKGNITSARNIIGFCKEAADADPLDFVRLSFLSNIEDIKKNGFRYFNSNKYKIKFIDRVLSPDWYGAGTKALPLYDKIRYTIRPIVTGSEPDKIKVINDLITGILPIEPFIYLVRTGFFDITDYGEVMAIMNQAMLNPMKTINILVDRSVLPPDYTDMIKYNNFKAWCLKEDEEPSGKEISDTIKT